MAARRLTRSSTPRVVSRAPQPTTRAQKPQLSAWAQGYVNPKGGYKPPAAVTGVPAAAGGGAIPGSAVAAPVYSLTNLPVDASYDAAVAAADRVRQNTLAAISGERVRTLGDYGFQEGPNGALTYDPNNPLSKASVLKKTYDTNRRATSQSMGAAGQLYSGAFQNSQDLINRNQVQGEDSLSKALIGFLARNTGQTTDANTGYENAVSQAAGDRVSRFQSNPNYDPASGTWKDPNAPKPAAAATPGAPPAASSTALEVWQKGTYKGRPAKNVKGKWYYVNSKGGLSPIPM